ncbi:MAG TPA: glutathione S-transferase [Alphaproteobacteria bacterium]|jgi:glutathione S-transferase|nr:glutathione S-transferase [Alphaproteobacteria bacterium]
MKLYDFARAPNPRRVRIFLAEKDIKVPTVQVDIAKREHKKDEFRAVNPLMRLPVLELDDGTCIAESVAICRYFEETDPEPPLFGRDPKEKALVEMWNRRMELNLLAHIAAAFRHTHPDFKDLEEQVPEWGEVNRRAAERQFVWFNDVLADRKFVAGDSYTIADITALCATDFAKVVKLRPMEDEGLPHLRRWYQVVSSRPSAKA